jgi:hypothetical protein
LQLIVFNLFIFKSQFIFLYYLYKLSSLNIMGNFEFSSKLISIFKKIKFAPKLHLILNLCWINLCNIIFHHVFLVYWTSNLKILLKKSSLRIKSIFRYTFYMRKIMNNTFLVDLFSFCNLMFLDVLLYKFSKTTKLFITTLNY